MEMSSARISSYFRIHGNVCIGILLFLAVAVLWPYRHFAGDDAYITFRFVHNFSTGSGFAFNADTPTYGSTSPLWVFMVAGTSRLGLSIPDAAHLLNWVLSILSVLLFARLAGRYLGPGLWSWIATLLFVLDPWFVRWAISGLENALALSLLIGVLLIQLSYRNSGSINWLAPLLAGLATLCRPEFVLLIFLLLIDNGLMERRRRLANLITGATVPLMVYLPWLLYALSIFHTAIPNTVIAKMSANHGLALKGVALYFGSFWIFQGMALLAVCVLGPLRRSAIAKYRDSYKNWLLPVAWGFLLPVVYIVGGAPVAGRYMMFGLPTYLLVGVAAWIVVSKQMPRVIIGAVIATVAVLLAVQYRYDWHITHWRQGMDTQMISAAERLKQISRPGDTVAASQIGVLGYYSERNVLDTLGLVSPEVFPYLRESEGAVWRYVVKQRPQYVFDSRSIEDLSKYDPAYSRLEVIGVYPVQREGAGAVGTLSTYHLYRTNW